MALTYLIYLIYTLEKAKLKLEQATVEVKRTCCGGVWSEIFERGEADHHIQICLHH